MKKKKQIKENKVYIHVLWTEYYRYAYRYLINLLKVWHSSYIWTQL